MKILVTGGAGFIGSNFILYWLDKHPDDFVVNFDLLTYAGNLENIQSVEKNPSYSFFRGDIRKTSDVEEVMKDIDWVVHFAAESHVDRSIQDAAPFVSTNVLGTQVLLASALKHGVKRFHHVSTDEVFGSLDLGSNDKFSESTKYDPRSPYSASKASSDHLVRAYHHTYGLPVTITNCSNNFGPLQFPEKLIPLAITNCMEGKNVPVYGDGKNVRDWLYVSDHCAAIDRVLHKGTIGETYCVGGSHADIDNKTVVMKILALLGKGQECIEYVKDRPGHDRRYAVDWTKIHTELGWEPEHTFDEWLEKTVAWYKDNPSWWKRVKDGSYQDYYKKQYGGIA